MASSIFEPLAMKSFFDDDDGDGDGGVIMMNLWFNVGCFLKAYDTIMLLSLYMLMKL